MSSLAAKRVGIRAGFSDSIDSKLVPYRVQPVPVFPAPLTCYTPDFLCEPKRCVYSCDKQPRDTL